MKTVIDTIEFTLFLAFPLFVTVITIISLV